MELYMLDATAQNWQLKSKDLILISLLVRGDYDPVSETHPRMGSEFTNVLLEGLGWLWHSHSAAACAFRPGPRPV